MKKLILLVLVAMGVTLPAIAQSDMSDGGSTYHLGVMAFGGYDMPVVQEDVGAGPLFGLGVRGNIWRFLHGELYFRSTSQGDVEEDLEFSGLPTQTVTYEGGSLTGFGANLLFAARGPASVWPYFMLGLSSNSLKPGSDFKKDESLMGYSFGFGTGVNLYHRTVYLDLNTSLLAMPFHDNNASRKNWQTRVGIQYFIPINM